MINDFGTLFRISNLTQRFWTNYYLPKRVVKIIVLFFFLITTGLRPSVHCAILRQYCSQKKDEKSFFYLNSVRIKFHLTTTIFNFAHIFNLRSIKFFHIQKLATCLKRQYFCCSHGNRSANVTSNVVRNIAGNVALCVRPLNTSHYETNNHDIKKYNLVVRKEEKRKPQRRRVNKNTLLSKSCNFLIILSSI